MKMILNFIIHIDRRCQRPRAAAVVFFAVALLLAPAPLAASAEEAGMAPGRIVFLLEYVGSDYELAVTDGRVVNAFEYAEMVDFTRSVAEAFERRRPDASAETRAGLEALRRLVREKAPEGAVRDLVDRLLPRVVAELGVEAWPARTPDVARGRTLYESDCAPCHGACGDGRGWASPAMEPPATSFLERRMRRVSPHQIAGAVRFGIPGTAMPSYAGVRTDDDIWDLAFFVVSLREKAVPVEHGPARVAPAPRAEAIGAARDLEHAFTAVADRVFPAVVGITALRAESERADVPPGRTTQAGGWQRSHDVRVRHPGFVPIRSGSGFFLEPNGTVLTARRLVVDPETGRPSERIEVELDDDRRYLARVIGLEPMIDLAVLRIEVSSETPVVEIGEGEAVRPGQWVIAVGDPPGIGRTFTPGSLSAVPRRECYQEEPEETLYQTSLWLEAGAFGGPVVDLDGRVLGMAQPPPGTEPLPGMPVALRILPIGLALTIYESLATEADEISPWLGLSVLELSRDLRRRVVAAPRTGVYIDDVHVPGPASRAGVRAGDVLVSIDGNRLLSVADFQRWLYLSGVGATVELEIHRDGIRTTIPVAIEQRPASLVPGARAP